MFADLVRSVIPPAAGADFDALCDRLAEREARVRAEVAEEIAAEVAATAARYPGLWCQWTTQEVLAIVEGCAAKESMGVETAQLAVAESEHVWTGDGSDEAVFAALDATGSDGDPNEHNPDWRNGYRTGLDWSRHLVDSDPERHRYLSTGCLHGEHGYCAAMVGAQGEKRPATCKFCDARCICDCHNPKGNVDGV